MAVIYNWDDTPWSNGSNADNEGQEEYTLLTPGAYCVRIVDVKKIWYDGNDNIPPCHAARVWMDVIDVPGCRIVDTFHLVDGYLWKMNDFRLCFSLGDGPINKTILTSVGREGFVVVCPKTIREGVTINVVKRYCDPTKDAKLVAWAICVKERDGYTCQLCGKKYPRKDMRAHHIKPRSVDPAAMYDLSNGICVCAECHEKCHPDNTAWRDMS